MRCCSAGPGTVGPVEDAERIEIVDVLRGFAVCGILFVNIFSFKAPGSFAAFGHEESSLDGLLRVGVLALGQGKFFTLFSVLFGWGFAAQFLRAEQCGQQAGFGRLFLRRLLVLGVIGAVHIALLSEGDFLLLYAVLGLLLLPLRRARPENLLRWAIWLVVIPALIYVVGLAELVVGRALPEGAVVIAEIDGAMLEQFRAATQSTTGAYLDPSISRQVAARVASYGRNAWVLLLQGPTVLAMFLLGLVVGRRDLARGTDHQALLRRVCRWSFGIGLPVALLAAAGVSQLPVLSALVVFQINAAVAGPILATGYCAGIALLWQRADWRQVLRPLAAVGRLALTNYLLQSLIATFLFYGHGLGLARRVSPSQAVVITVAILAAQMLGSRWWIRRYRFGPAEWLWRTLTYGRSQPMRRATG